MKRIAIIGSKSFLAGHFSAVAGRRGHQITAIDRPDADIRSPSAIAGALEAAQADVVVNFAAISFVGGQDERAFYETNSFGQANVLRALNTIGFTGTHVFISSANVYGATSSVSREADTPAPVNHYACSKVLAEQFCRFLGGGFEIRIVRPFNCIGVGQPTTFLASKIVDAFRRGLPELVLGNTDIERDFVDARDFAQMMALLIEKGSPHSVLNFCNGETVSISNLIAAAARISGHTLVVKSEQGLRRANDLSRQIGDNSRISEMGYRRVHSIDDTLAWMLSA